MITVLMKTVKAVVERVEVHVTKSPVSNKKNRTTLSTLFWLLVVKFEHVRSIILLQLKRNFLLEILR